MNKATKCVHEGTYHDQKTGGVNTPIFTSSSFEYVDRENVHYPRYFNTPNQEAVIRKLCSLEGAEDGVLFSSGMAAISTTIFTFAGAGDHLVLLDDLYGGTHAFATDMFRDLGIEFSFVPSTVEAIQQAVTPSTKAIIIEFPEQPFVKCHRYCSSCR
jgi:cystathionine beta-lyase/cystathionine gamma-synthase